MCVSFEQELKANKQIKANLHKELGREVTSLAEVLRDHEVAKKFMHTKFILFVFGLIIKSFLYYVQQKYSCISQRLRGQSLFLHQNALGQPTCL